MIRISLLICIICMVTVSTCKEMDIYVNITQLFVHKISPEMLSWNEKERGSDFHYTITSMEGPDIPPWLFVKYIKKNNNLYVFGTAPKDLNVELLEISITSLYSYRTKYFKLKIWFNFIDEYAKNEINIRIRNLDTEEMLNRSLQNNLIDIFENNFWKASKGRLYVTFMAASDNVGYQLPLNPNDTAGVIIRLGSTANFSEELLDLQNETIPLTKHCPSFYKRITVERFFRPKNFIIDWCSFKLITSNVCHHSSSPVEFVATSNCSSSDNNVLDSILGSDEEFLILREELPQSPVHGIITLFVIVPSVCFGLIVTSWLSSFMCFNNKKLKQQDIKESEFQEGDPDSELLFHF